MARSAKLSCPPDRRAFSNNWDELSYLCDKVDYYLHVVRIRSRASRFVLRIRQSLRTRCRAKGAIVAETARSLICEYDGKWRQSAMHRKRELELILQLYNSFTDGQGLEVQEFALEKYRRGDVSARLSRIQTTYMANAEGKEVAIIDQLRRRVEHS